MIKKLILIIGLSLLLIFCLGCDSILGPPEKEIITNTVIDTLHTFSDTTIYIDYDPFIKQGWWGAGDINGEYVIGIWALIKLRDANLAYANVKLHATIYRETQKISESWAVEDSSDFYREWKEAEQEINPILLFDGSIPQGRGLVLFPLSEIPDESMDGATFGYYLSYRRVNGDGSLGKRRMSKKMYYKFEFVPGTYK